MIPIPKKSAPVILVVLLLILAAVFIIPRSSGDTIETGFGNFRVEIITNDCCGNTMMMQPSSIIGNALEFTKDGSVIEEVTVNIYATATGNGFDSCELDFDTCDPPVQIGYSMEGVQEGYAIGFDYHELTPITEIISLGTEKKVFTDTITLSDILVGQPESQTLTLDIEFYAQNMRFRGKSSTGDGDWQDTDGSFTVNSDVLIQWSQESGCGDGDCNGDEDCWNCPEDCGTCNCKIADIDVTASGSLQVWDATPAMHAYDYADGSGWDAPWYYAPGGSESPKWSLPFPFDCGKGVAVEVYVKPSSDGSLYGNIKAYGPSGQTIVFDYPDWSDIQSGGLVAESGTWYALGGFTWDMTDNGNWDIDVSVSLTSYDPPEEEITVDITSCPSAWYAGLPITMEYRVNSAYQDTVESVETRWENGYTGEVYDSNTVMNVQTNTIIQAPTYTIPSGYGYDAIEFKVLVEACLDYRPEDSCYMTVLSNSFRMVSTGLFSITATSDYLFYEDNGRTLGD